jgi:hypothetical protein
MRDLTTLTLEQLIAENQTLGREIQTLRDEKLRVRLEMDKRILSGQVVNLGVPEAQTLEPVGIESQEEVMVEEPRRRRWWRS